MTGFVNNLLAVTPQAYTTSGLGENIDAPLASSLLQVTPGADGDSISGFIPAQAVDGTIAFVMNVHQTSKFVLAQTTASSAGFRMVMPPGYTKLTLLPGAGVLIVYNQGVGWRPMIGSTLYNGGPALLVLGV